jgi:hypothetical protein
MRDETTKEEDAARRKEIHESEAELAILESEGKKLERQQAVLGDEVRRKKIGLARLAVDLEKEEEAFRLVVEELVQTDEKVKRAKKHRGTL